MCAKERLSAIIYAGEIGRNLAQKERESDVERLEEQQQCH